MKARSVIQLCGLGAQPPEETTLEVLEALERSSVVFLEPEDPALKRWLKPWCRRLKAVSSLGPDDGARCDAILDSLSGVTSVATWGHPLLTSRLGIELCRRARSRGVELLIPGAVSPVGSAFARASAFFGGDYGHHGIQACSLDEALDGSAELDGGLPLVVFGSGQSEEAWRRLAAKLRVIFSGRARPWAFPCGRAGGQVDWSRLPRVVGGSTRAVILAAPLEPVRAGPAS